jgi:PAS domain S-box-containing protein
MTITNSISHSLTNAKWFHCACVLGGICFATLIRFPFQPIIHDASPFIFYFPLVVAVAILFGLGPGLLATALSVLPANYFWMPPDNAFEMNLSDAWHIVGFSFAGFSVSWLSETARKRKQLEEHLRATIANLGEAIVTTDCRGSIVYLNTIARVLTELHGDEAIGRTVGNTLDLVAENGEHSLNGTFQTALTSDEIENLPRRVIISSKSGRHYRVEQRTSRILDTKGRKLGSAILFHRLECDDDVSPAPAVTRKENSLNAMSLKSLTRPPVGVTAMGAGQNPVTADRIEAHEFNQRGLFIGGPAKSGTTLLMSLLDSHPQLIVFPEETAYLAHRRDYSKLKSWQARLELLLRNVSGLTAPVRCYDTSPGCGMDARDYTQFDYERFAALARKFINRPWMNDSLLLSEMIRAYGMALGADCRNCARWVEKTPRTETYQRLFDELFPHAQLIQIIRDPRAVFASFKNRIINSSGSHTKAHRLPRSWNRSAREIPRWRQDPSRFLLVRYEDLVKNPRDVLETICRFGGFEFSENMLEPTRAGNRWLGNSAFYKAFSGISAAPADRWKDCLTEDEIWWIELHCRKGMDLAGYSLQTDARFSLRRWFRRLPGESWYGYVRARRASLCQGVGLLKECRF